MKIYIDTTTEASCMGVLLQEDAQAVFCGTVPHAEPEKYRNSEPAAHYARLGLHFWFGKAPQPPFYTVPQTTLLAHDGVGGYFLATEEQLYHWDGVCRRICTGLGDFPENWQAAAQPCADIAVYPSRAEAERVHHIYSIHELMEEFA